MPKEWLCWNRGRTSSWDGETLARPPPNRVTTDCPTFQQVKLNLKTQVGVWKWKSTFRRRRRGRTSATAVQLHRAHGGSRWSKKMAGRAQEREGVSRKRRQTTGGESRRCACRWLCAHTHVLLDSTASKEEVQCTSMAGFAQYFRGADKPHDTRLLYFRFCITLLKVGKKLIMPKDLKFYQPWDCGYAVNVLSS